MKLTKTQKKVIIGTSVGVLGAAAIVTPIVITYINNKGQWPFMVDEIDQQTGITIDTYNSMKDQFKKAYKQKLEEKWTPADEMERALSKADDSLAELDQQFQTNLDLAAKGTDEPLDYTKLTTALSNYARNNCGVSLTRKSNYTITDLKDGYEQLRSANALYMQGLGTLTNEQIEARLREADEQYNQIEQELVAQYPGDDFAVYIEGSKRILECFEAENAEIAALSSQVKLSQFLENSAITYKQYDPAKNDGATPNYYSSDLVQNVLKVDSVVKDPYMNAIYSFTDKNSGTPFTFEANKALPGYIVQPILKEKYIDDNSKANIEAKKEIKGDLTNEEVSQDATDYTNAYSLGFDWTVKSERYLKAHPKMSNAEMDTVTAHLRGVTDVGQLNDESTVNDVLDNTDIQILSHSIGEGYEQTSEHLEQTYFSGKDADGKAIDKIEFRFNEKDVDAFKKYKLEQFYDDVDTSTNGTENIIVHSSEALARAGIQVKQHHIVADTDPITGETTYTESETPWLRLEAFYDNFKTETSGKDDDTIKAITKEIGGETCHVGLIYEFIKQCALHATAKVNNKPEEKGGVQMFNVSDCQIYASYKGQEDNPSASVKLGKYNFFAPLSEKYFMGCADKYNRVRDEFSIYIDDENVMTELNDQDTHFWILEGIEAVKAAVDLGLLIWRIVFKIPVFDESFTTDRGEADQTALDAALKTIKEATEAFPGYSGSAQLVKMATDGKMHLLVTNNWGEKKTVLKTWQKVCLAITYTLEIAKLGADMAIWGVKVTKPITAAIDDLEKFKKKFESEISEVSDDLDDYLDVYPLLKDKETLEYGDDFNSKYEAFSKKLEGKTFAEFNAEYNLKWNNIETQGVYADLLSKAEKNNASLDHFIEIFSNFGLNKVTGLTLSILGVVVSLVNYALLWNVPGKQRKMFVAGFFTSSTFSIILAYVKYRLERYREKSYDRVEASIRELQERVLAQKESGYEA